MFQKILFISTFLGITLSFNACGSSAEISTPLQNKTMLLSQEHNTSQQHTSHETNTTTPPKETNTTLPPKDNNSTQKTISDNQKIFLLGGSTVAVDRPPYAIGWGHKVSPYLKHPENVYNLAVGGTSSRSYKQADPTGDWNQTKALITHTDIHEGAFLLIPYGINDVALTKEDALDDTTKTTFPGRNNSYYNELKVYVDWAKSHEVTPILITPLETLQRKFGDAPMQHLYQRSYGDYAQTVRLLAEDENVTLLDLEQKSYVVFNSYAKENYLQLLSDFSGGDPNNNWEDDGETETVHFSDKGSKKVVEWIRDLACAPSGNKALCAQFLAN